MNELGLQKLAGKEKNNLLLNVNWNIIILWLCLQYSLKSYIDTLDLFPSPKDYTWKYNRENLPIIYELNWYKNF